MSAYISRCGRYRYVLRRYLTGYALETARTLVVCMLNPSTADGIKNDATIRRLISLAMAWGFTEIVVVNLYAYRATDPADVWKADDPIGPENDTFIYTAACEHKTVLCAWGAEAPIERQEEVTKMLERAGATLMCLGVTKNGSPRHPLYIKQSTLPVGYSGRNNTGRTP